MSSVAGARPAERTARLWFPNQHGAWAMLAVPLLLGVAASAPDPWHLVLAGAAVAGYLASATAQAWLRARRRPSFLPSLALYAGILAMLGAVLVVAFPLLVLSALVIVPVGALTLAGARPGTKRDLANSVSQVVMVLVLVPAAAGVSGAFEATRVAAATLVAAGYLFGTVLVVRSVIRERGDRAFVTASIGYHVGLVVVAAALLPFAYAVVAVVLTLRAVGLPLLQRRWAGTRRALRPVHVGMTEIVVSTLLVVVAFAVPV
jgi:hypothetical protein